MSFSIPINAMCTRGTVVHMRMFPSFSTVTTVPVSATAKFAPLTPTPAFWNISRSARRAMAVSSSGTSVRSDLTCSTNRSDTSSRVLWMAGSHDVRGPLTRQLNDELAQIGLNGANSRRFERVVQLHFLAHHGLGFHHFLRRRIAAQYPQQSGKPRRPWRPSAPCRRCVPRCRQTGLR